MPSRPAVSTSRRLFTPLKEKDSDSQGDNRRHIFDELKAIIPNGCFTSFYERASKTDAPMEPAANVNLIIQLAATCKTVEEFLSQMPILTDLQVLQIETETRGQATNQTWVSQRRGRITASNFYSVFTRVNTIKANPSKDHNVEPLLRKLMGCDVIKENIPALNYGKEYEPIAKEKYAALMNCNHKEFTVTESGLFVDSARPYLGASPDLFVHCTCCGAGLSEIKCPLSIADEIPSAANLPYLVECDNITTLKKDHAYYAQIQGQLALSKRKYCDFFVFTHVGYFMQRIYFDNSYWEKLVSNLEYFFNNFVASRLLSGESL